MVATRHLCPHLLVMYFSADMVFHPVFLNLELSVCFFLGGLYNDNVRTMLMTAAQVMMSTLFGLIC